MNFKVQNVASLNTEQDRRLNLEIISICWSIFSHRHNLAPSGLYFTPQIWNKEENLFLLQHKEKTKQYIKNQYGRRNWWQAENVSSCYVLSET